MTINDLIGDWVDIYLFIYLFIHLVIYLSCKVGNVFSPPEDKTESVVCVTV